MVKVGWGLPWKATIIIMHNNFSLEVVEVHTPEATHGGEVVWHKRSTPCVRSSKYPGADRSSYPTLSNDRRQRVDTWVYSNTITRGKQNMCLLELFKCFSKSAGMSPSPCQVQRCNKKLCDALFMNTVAEEKSTETWQFHRAHITSSDKSTQYIQTNTPCGNRFVQNSKGKLHELANVPGSHHRCVGVRTWQGLPSVSRDREEFPLLTSGYKSSSSSRCNKKAHLSQVMNMHSLHGWSSTRLSANEQAEPGSFWGSDPLSLANLMAWWTNLSWPCLALFQTCLHFIPIVAKLLNEKKLRVNIREPSKI